MPEKISFTQSRVANIPAPTQNPDTSSSTRKEYHDAQQPKLVLRVSSTGNKSFAVLKKDSAGRTKRITIGQFPEVSVADARDKATTILAQLHSGTDPIEEKRKQKIRSIKLQPLLDSYIENHTLKPRTIQDYQDKIRWGFADWLNKPASSITEKMVLTRHKKLSERGKTATNDAFVRLRAILNYGHAIGAITSHNPVTILSNARLWHKRNQRKEIIQSHQLSEWIAAVNQLSPMPHQAAFLMMLYMGFRIMETYSLRWSDVDLVNGLITQRDTKNSTDHELPIPTALTPILKELHEISGDSTFLFPSKGSTEKHLTYPKKAIAQINKSVRFHFNPHMTRHTFTTIAEAVGTPKTMIDRLTNHTTTNDVTGGYIHTEIETLRSNINKIATYIDSKNSSSDNVIQLYK